MPYVKVTNSALTLSIRVLRYLEKGLRLLLQVYLTSISCGEVSLMTCRVEI